MSHTQHKFDLSEVSLDIEASQLRKGDKIIGEVTSLNDDDMGCTAVEVKEITPPRLVLSIHKTKTGKLGSPKFIINQNEQFPLCYKNYTTLRVIRERYTHHK